MHSYKSRKKNAVDFMSEVWDVLQFHLVFCRVQPLLTPDILIRDWENLIYCIRQRKSRHKHMPGSYSDTPEIFERRVLSGSRWWWDRGGPMGHPVHPPLVRKEGLCSGSFRLLGLSTSHCFSIICMGCLLSVFKTESDDNYNNNSLRAKFIPGQKAQDKAFASLKSCQSA